MPGLRQRLPSLLVCAVVAFAGPRLAAAEKAEDIEFFEKKIRPVLVEHCYSCHSAGAKKLRGGLLLDSRAALQKGGDSGPALVAGDAAASLLVKALRYDELKMPPSGKLPARVVADFEAWIRRGAVDPREAKTVATAAPRVDVEAGKRAWAFQRPRRHVAPALRQQDWPQRPLDRFVLARLEQAGLTPAPAAEARTLLRRLTFDLTGLPPTPEESEDFARDTSANAQAAVEKVVERLLASPHYGERWARLWLDVARYAEDQAHIVGKNDSLFYPNAYLYRDWVIHALNADLPYDRFVKLQLAADLIEPKDQANHAALGYLGLGPKYYSRGSLAVMADEWEDRVDVVGRGLLGLTVACARCHDHKYDPLATEDYYALAGVFASTSMYNRPLDAKRAKTGGGDAKLPKDALHIVREGKPTDLNVFVRGDVNTKGAAVPRRFPRVLSAREPQPFRDGSGRRELAEAIASRDNPLTARVIVNRVWAQLFGRGLVGTPSNFGALGEPPTHPELLDDLAVRFMEAGWSLKWLQREIVLSAAYRQSSRANSQAESADPENRLLGRMSRRRLSIEAWRDSLLAAAGRLDGAVGGTSIDIADLRQTRRTVYSKVSRLSLNPLLALFDFPDANLHADRRVETITPLQKLFVMNSPFMTQLANALAERVTTDAGDSTPEAFVQRAYLVLYGREPSEVERRLGLSFLQAQGGRQEYAHVLLASSEMMYLD
jgi:hypothetical protein